MLKCDVLVVGAGPAGLACSIITAKHGLNTIIVEKNKEIGYPVKTSALTWSDVIKEWKLKRSVVQWYTNFEIASLHSKMKASINFKRRIACTVNFHKFLKQLALQSIRFGSKIILNAKVVDSKLEKNKVYLKDKKMITAKIFIDASGPSAVLARKENLFPKKYELGIGIEREYYNVKVKSPTTFKIFVGEKEIIPEGYGWFFPLGKEAARIGIATSIKVGKKQKIF